MQSGPFTAIAGKTEATASITGQGQSSWYRLAAVCNSSGLGGTSGVVNVTQQAAANCYCVPTYQYNNQYGYINSLQLGTINNVTGRNAAAPNNYYSYISEPTATQTTDLAQGSSQTIVINVAGAATQNFVAAWIDYNADGDFTDPGEQLGAAARQYNVDVSFPFTVPPTAVPGLTRLRIREAYGYDLTDPCALITSNGETEDYTVNIVVPTPCTESEYVTYYADGDEDSFGDAGTTIRACPGAPPAGYVTNSTDCNDTEPNIHAAVTYYADSDNDGFGDPSSTKTACTAPDGYVSNGTDNCPTVANADQLDTDKDGEGDACDTDDDGDGDLDASDNCPLVYNADQLDTDGDGTGNVCDSDDDGDGDLDASDNCPLVSNADQLDTDGDGTGNVCDSDDDGDGDLDASDNCPLSRTLTS